MSKKTSFEEALRQKMNELPLPDENESWQKMKALLNEKEKRRSFFFFRNEKIVGAALLLCILLAGIILITGSEKKSVNIATHQDVTTGKASKNAYFNQIKRETNSEKTSKIKDTTKAHSNTALSAIISSYATSENASKSNTHLSVKNNTATIKSQNEVAEKQAFTKQLNIAQTNKQRAWQDDTYASQNGDIKTQLKSTTSQKNQTNFSIDSSLSLTETNNSLSPSVSDDSNQNTTVVISNIQKADSTSNNNAAAKAMIRAKRHNSYFIDAGIGIKQQLPVGNQTLTFYNYNGNKGWLGDYIPSLYIKLEKEQRWFLQGEFHYAAPRLVSKVAYWQKTTADYGHGSTTMDKYYLQKTWYNEIPVSFNLYLRPSLSIGAGIMYNRLRGASAKRETSVYDVVSGHSVYDESVLPWKSFTDSFLYKTNASLLLQTDYEKEKWTFGLRYLHDMQPFLTYTLPDGAKKDKQNTSLELLIRYRLYRSDKFRIGKL